MDTLAILGAIIAGVKKLCEGKKENAQTPRNRDSDQELGQIVVHRTARAPQHQPSNIQQQQQQDPSNIEQQQEQGAARILRQPNIRGPIGQYRLRGVIGAPEPSFEV